MTRLTRFFDQTFYPGVADNWDDLLFRSRILAQINTDSVVLDVGAGAGIVESMNFREQAKTVCGIDLDPRVMDNPYLDDARVSAGESIPYPDDTFDVVFSDNVLEHLENPLQVFQEVSRVLKPAGKFFFKTPNKNHYMPMIARLTPHRFHAFINGIRGRAATDTFPTRYRANTGRSIRELASESGLRVDSLAYIEGRPEYTRFFAPLYLIGILYERGVNLTRYFAPLRILLVGELSKDQY